MKEKNKVKLISLLRTEIIYQLSFLGLVIKSSSYSLQQSLKKSSFKVK